MAKAVLTFGLYQGDALQRRETVAQDIVKIGKDSTSHLRVDDTWASQLHAVIEVASPDDLTLVNFGNEPGTQVNGVRVNKCKLHVGDQIQVGGTKIVLEAAQSPAPAAAPSQPAALSTSMPTMCPHCGANACTRQRSCELCGGVLADGGALPAPVDVHWVQLQLEVECVFCRNRSPVGQLDEGRFLCLSCAHELPYLAGFWQKRLDFASAAGDYFWSRFGRFPAWQWPKGGMAEGELEGLMRMLWGLGGDRQKIFAEGSPSHGLGDPISNKQKLTMAPGHPLCDSCHRPLTAQFGARGAVTMSCSGCGSRKSYDAPAVALAACGEVIAVVAPDHLHGAKSVGLKGQPQSAAVAITCPSCGSALELAPGERLTICKFCKTESIVPLGVMAQAFSSRPGAQPIWLALRAPAKLRRTYARAAQAEAESARRAAAATPAIDSGGEPPADAMANEDKEKQVKRSAWPRVLITGLVLGVALVVIAYALPYSAKRKFSIAIAETFPCKAGEECVCGDALPCRKVCSGKGCEMKCPAGSWCIFTCDAGGCKATAEGSAERSSSVDFDCHGGGCELQCDNAECALSCDGGQCLLKTHNTSSNKPAKLSCRGGNCKVECGGSGECTITDCKGCTCEQEKGSHARCADESPTCEPGKPCVCDGKGDCTKRCSGKGCKMECPSSQRFSHCNFACEQGGCTVITDHQNVKLSCPGGGCTTHCGLHSDCETTDCKGGGCKCNEEGMIARCKGIGAEVETAVPNCACAAGDGWKEPKLEWELISKTYFGEPDEPGSWQGNIAIHPPANAVTTNRQSFQLTKGAALPFFALADKPGIPFRAGIACGTHFMAIVGGEHVNRFDADTRGRVQQSYAKLAAPVKPPPDSRDGACFALTTKNGMVEIPLQNGRRVMLDLASGQLR
jgi:hypothetical protein